MFVNVAVLRNQKQLDRLFTYDVPEHLTSKIKKGSRIVVPFGKEWIEAVVFELIDTFENPSSFEVKSVLFVFEDGIFLRNEDLALVDFMRKNYLATYAEAIALIFPSGILTVPKTLYSVTETGKAYVSICKKPSENAVLKNIYENGPIEGNAIKVDYADSTLKTALGRLTAQGYLKKVLIFETQVKDRYEKWLSVNTSTQKIMDQIPPSRKAQIKLLEYLLKVKAVSQSQMTSAIKVSTSVVNRMLEIGAIDVYEKEVQRLPEFMQTHVGKAQIQLNDEQKKVCESIEKLFLTEPFKPFLIHGVTGSGKTEVYADLIEKTIKQGKRVLLMVPEIALTPQIVSRFVTRFPNAKIALIHSKISKGERHDQWKGIIANNYDIVIGARSAIFTPIDNLGLIVMDEAHEHSYRSEKKPRYQTVALARFKAMCHHALLVLGTATPSIEDYYRCKQGEMHYMSLENRYNAKPLPPVHIVDMREELLGGNKSMLSRLLYEKIDEALQRKEQVIILLNRKGHSTFVSCRSCGFTLSCPNCDVTLTYFKGMKTVRCNYCSYESFVPKKCPKCSSDYFKYFGVGTEKVEEYLHELFPQAVIDRMDRTTTTKKGSVERIIQNVSNEKTDILIGTQMVAKGLDFRKVSVVGILSADLMLNLPNFQAAERAYQLFTQVSGRAGRADIEGEVVLQTYTPDHYALNPMSYEAFYNEEIQFRKMMHYPPYCTLINLIFTSKEETVAKQYAERSETYLRRNFLKYRLQNEVEIYPANLALLKKIDNQYRYQVLLKVSDQHFDQVRDIISKLDDNFTGIQDCQISIDLEAVNIL